MQEAAKAPEDLTCHDSARKPVPGQRFCILSCPCLDHLQASTVYQFHNICISQLLSTIRVINAYGDLARGVVAAHAAVVHVGYCEGVSDYNCCLRQQPSAMSKS